MSSSIGVAPDRKDLYLYRWLIGGALVAGLASLVIAGISEGDNERRTSASSCCMTTHRRARRLHRDATGS